MNLKEKLTKFCKSTSGKVAASVASATAVLAPATTAFCAEGDNEFVSGIRTLWDSIKGDLSIGSLVAIIGIVLGSCVILALFWFGLRYVIRKIMSAVKKGRVSA